MTTLKEWTEEIGKIVEVQTRVNKLRSAIRQVKTAKTQTDINLILDINYEILNDFRIEINKEINAQYARLKQDEKGLYKRVIE